MITPTAMNDANSVKHTTSSRIRFQIDELSYSQIDSESMRMSAMTT